MDFTLRYETARQARARRQAASNRSAEYSRARRIRPRQERYPISGCGLDSRIARTRFPVWGPIRSPQRISRDGDHSAWARWDAGRCLGFVEWAPFLYWRGWLASLRPLRKISTV